MCFALWLLMPALASVGVYFSNLALDAPEVGWRMRHHETADAFDSIILAGRAMQNSPPEWLWRRRLASAAAAAEPSLVLSQSTGFQGMTILFTARHGSNLLTAAGIADMVRVERAAAAINRDYCLLRLPPLESATYDYEGAALAEYTNSEWKATAQCTPPHSITRLFVRANGSLVCDPRAFASTVSAERCVQRRLSSAARLQAAAEVVGTCSMPFETLAAQSLATGQVATVISTITTIVNEPSVDNECT